MIYVFDLDGTLCNNKHRLHHIAGESKNYHAYHRACVDDAPLPLLSLVSSLLEYNEKSRPGPLNCLHFFTGRSDIAFTQTAEWFYQHCGLSQIDGTVLRMRKEGDWRKDWVIKEEWLNELRKMHGAGQNIIAFDDRKQCVDMYRRNGVTCCDVSGEEF